MRARQCRVRAYVRAAGAVRVLHCFSHWAGSEKRGRATYKVVVKWCLLSSDVSWHIRDKLWPMPKHGSIILYVHGNQKARRLGRTAQAGPLDCHTAPELCNLQLSVSTFVGLSGGIVPAAGSRLHTDSASPKAPRPPGCGRRVSRADGTETAWRRRNWGNSISATDNIMGITSFDGTRQWAGLA